MTYMETYSLRGSKTREEAMKQFFKEREREKKVKEDRGRKSFERPG